MGYDDTETENSISNEQFEFTGKASEYFSIWIVNVALTILTLGIYSAWAKVRTNQYFYSNTLLDGSSFRYTARPTQILKGRVIAFIMFVAYYASSLMSAKATAISILIIMLLVPAFVVMSLAFRLRNSVYRNVRFGFDKKFTTAYKVFSIPVVFIGVYLVIAAQIKNTKIVDPAQTPTLSILFIILLLAIFLMVPWWEYMITRFKIVHAKFGSVNFSFTATVKNYFIMYAKGYGLSMLIFALLGIFMAIIIPALASKGEPNPAMAGMIPILIMVLVLPIYIWIFAYFQTKRTNLVFGNLQIQGHNLKSELKTGYMMQLYFTNTLAILISLGLLMPWAKIRTARYKASVTSIDIAGNLNHFISSQEKQQSAVGEEIGEMFDMDIGF